MSVYELSMYVYCLFCVVFYGYLKFRKMLIELLIYEVFDRKHENLVVVLKLF